MSRLYPAGQEELLRSILDTRVWFLKTWSYQQIIRFFWLINKKLKNVRNSARYNFCWQKSHRLAGKWWSDVRSVPQTDSRQETEMHLHYTMTSNHYRTLQNPANSREIQNVLFILHLNFTWFVTVCTALAKRGIHTQHQRLDRTRQPDWHDA